jgi:hypothetical protein
VSEIPWIGLIITGFPVGIKKSPIDPELPAPSGQKAGSIGGRPRLLFRDLDIFR